jgi:hypothetical protein
MQPRYVCGLFLEGNTSKTHDHRPYQKRIVMVVVVFYIQGDMINQMQVRYCSQSRPL